jgi:ATP-dependent helicase HrpA
VNHPEFLSWQAKLASVMYKDKHGLSRQLHRLKKQPSETGQVKLVQQFEHALKRYDARLKSVPTPTFDNDLPINQRRDEIAKLISEHQVVVLCGETGSGKTTQLPKICLSIGRGVAGAIGHTQPRRVAARSVAARIGDELKVGNNLVACKMRFTDQSQADTLVKVMTDGILLAETQSDRYFNQYDTLIIDEAHERSLNIDFLLGYLKTLLPKRPDLKVIITSATIDPERFAKHFAGAPIIEVSGRTYPVETHYLTEAQCDDKLPWLQLVQEAVEEISRNDRGDILIFLAGERDIRDCANQLRKCQLQDTDVLPMYARLNVAAQQKILKPGKRRRIILATNVAETSITVPGIRYVIDPGFARVSRYSVRSKIQRLPIEKISQASANQRMGRCGRVSAGICYRLYSKADFLARDEFTDPEIRRTNLAAVILQLLSLKLGDVRSFPFIEPPDGKSINDGYKLLHELGAVDDQNTMTSIGRQLSKLPMDPRLARMIIAGHQHNSLTEILIIVSAMSIQDPRERPLEKQQAADAAHEKFRDQKSDFMSYLTMWQFFHTQSQKVSNSQLRKICQKNFLSFIRIREWIEVHRQLVSVCKTMSMKTSSTKSNYDAIHISLLSGLLSHVALKDEKQQFIAARQRKVQIFPGSGLAKQPPKWIMSATLLETNKLYAHTNAKINPDWVEPIGSHIVNRSYSEPHWQNKQQQVAAFEQVNLMGLILVAKRRVNYGPIDPKVAHDVFIRDALVGQKLHSREKFYQHYLKLLKQIEDLENKSRRRDVLIDEQSIVSRFKQDIPERIYSTKNFHQWLKKAKQKDPELLMLTQSELMVHSADSAGEAQFPNHIVVGVNMRLKVTYAFTPGEKQDGMNIWLPQILLSQVKSEWFEWLVPGLLLEKVTALIRALPKSIRTSFVPAPQYAQTCLAECDRHKGSLYQQLSKVMYDLKRVKVTSEQLQTADIDPYFRPYFQIIDEQQKVVGQGRDLGQLQSGLKMDDVVVSVNKHPLEQTGLTEWLNPLPSSVACEQAGVKYAVFPALVAEGKTVGVQLFSSELLAQASMQKALIQLAGSALSQPLKYLSKELKKSGQLFLLYSNLPHHPKAQDKSQSNQVKWLSDINDWILQQSVLSPMPGSPAELNQRLKQAQTELVAQGQALAKTLIQILTGYQVAKKIIKKKQSLRTMETMMDCQLQLDNLLYQGFLSKTPSQWLNRIPVYLQAVEKRVEKAERDVVRDREYRLEIEPLWANYEKKVAFDDVVDREWESYRWQLEELRVSLFAQPLKTLNPISVKRFKKMFLEVM